MKMIYTKCDKHGFNLIESAIVLGVVGLVIGGLWAAVSTVHENRLATKTVADVFVIAQNMQNKLSATDAASLPSSDLTSYAISADVYPADWIKNGSAFSPYGGYSVIGKPTVSSSNFDFYFQVNTHSQCMRLLQAFQTRNENTAIYSRTGVTYLQTYTNGSNLLNVTIIDADCATTNETIIVSFPFTQHN